MIDQLFQNADKLENDGYRTLAAMLKVCSSLTIDECAAIYKTVGVSERQWKQLEQARLPEDQKNRPFGFTVEKLRAAVAQTLVNNARKLR